MVRSEPREEDPSINMVLRSDATTGGDVREQPGETRKGHDGLTKELDFKMEQVKGTFK